MIHTSCPIPDNGNPELIQLAHGDGGLLTAQLIDTVFSPAFKNQYLDRGHDSAILPSPECRLAMSTDTFVVTPQFFPGGNIGDLAVNGTVNDLLAAGATPRWLSAGFVIEEGFPMESLRRIVNSMAQAAREAEVEIVTGDTKVVERGHCDGLFINTTGVGYLPHGLDIDPRGCLRPGDVIILSGSIANHGMAVMSQREGLKFESQILSDTASLGDLVHNLLDVVEKPRVMRDPTRGGLSSTLNELAQSSGVDINLVESAIPIRPDTASACALLGLDPLYVANEGLMIVVVAPEQAREALAAMKRSAHGADSTIIGSVEAARNPANPTVWLQMPLGNRRRVERPAAAQLPRIC